MSPLKTSVTAEDLRAECLKERYSNQLVRPEVFPSVENWQYIIERKMTGIGGRLYRKYLVSWLMNGSMRTDFHIAALEYFPKYVTAVDRSYALDVVYSDVDSCPQATIAVIEQAQLFDAKKLLEILNTDGNHLSFVVDCLVAFQPDYNSDDLADMRRLLSAVRDPEPLGEIRTTRNVFGQSEKYICPRGHVNDANQNYCQSDDCGLNIYGLTAKQDEVIDDFERRINALGNLLNS